jgi:mannose-6-phosphate isomerase-like protein (cupin superfamily)
MQLESEANHFWQNDPHRITTDEKVWGTERIICREPHACKIMTLFPGQQVSLHWHANKVETFILTEGHLTVELVNQNGQRNTMRLTKPYSSITIKQNTPHTFYCPDGQEGNTVFVEASTTDYPNDSYRIYPSGPKGKGFIDW